MTRRAGVAIAVLGAAAAVTAAALVVHGNARPDSPSPRLLGQATWPPGRRTAPGFTLPDQAGRATSLSSLRGRPVLLAFLDSRCRGACAREPRAIATALRYVPRAERPVVAVVGANPHHDSPGSARAAMRRWGVAGATSWHWLLGSRSRLAPVLSSYRIATAAGTVRTPAVYLIDQRGFERAGMLYPFPPGWIAENLQTLADEG